MLPLVAQLISSGVSYLGNALLNKGKDAVEKKLGVKLPDLGKPVSQEKLAELRQLEMDHEEKLLELQVRREENEIKAGIAAQTEVTKRWEADLHSDNQLSKNIRPGSLIFLLLVVTVFAVLDSFPEIGFTIKPVWVDLFSGLLQIAFGGYFVARTVEKGINVLKSGK